MNAKEVMVISRLQSIIGLATFLFLNMKCALIVKHSWKVVESTWVNNMKN